jgi:hypothetical protein
LKKRLMTLTQAILSFDGTKTSEAAKLENSS